MYCYTFLLIKKLFKYSVFELNTINTKKKVFILFFSLIILNLINPVQSNILKESINYPGANVVRINSSIKDWYLDIYSRNGGETIMELFYKDKLIYRHKDYMYYIQFFGHAPIEKNSKKNYLVFTTYSGGTHCCSETFVFNLEKNFKKVAHLEIAGLPTKWQDVNKNGVKELLSSDYTFDYWYASHAKSAIIPIIWKFEKNKFTLAINLLKTPKPSLKTIIKQANSIKNNKEIWKFSINSNYFPHEITNNVLKLLYGGHFKLANLFFNKAWNNKDTRKNKFIIEFNKQIMLSPYWKKLKQLGKEKKLLLSNIK